MPFPSLCRYRRPSAPRVLYLDQNSSAGLHRSANSSKALIRVFDNVHEGILVNAVAPSIMGTAQNRRAMPKANYDAWSKVEEVAATILFLASPGNRCLGLCLRSVVGTPLRASAKSHDFARLVMPGRAAQAVGPPRYSAIFAASSMLEGHTIR
jgi:hypothetical protein